MSVSRDTGSKKASERAIRPPDAASRVIGPRRRETLFAAWDDEIFLGDNSCRIDENDSRFAGLAAVLATRASCLIHVEDAGRAAALKVWPKKRVTGCAMLPAIKSRRDGTLDDAIQRWNKNVARLASRRSKSSRLATARPRLEAAP
jgi:hypothetical protein